LDFEKSESPEVGKLAQNIKVFLEIPWISACVKNRHYKYFTIHFIYPVNDKEREFI
jgi:hypothetical protein